MLPSFSIIMSTYNRSFCISNAIDSVLKQNYSSFELIIVDDGSTDETLELICNNYSHEIEKGIIKYIEEKHVGVCHSRNIGLKNAKNDWIGYLDSDNILLPNFFETFASQIIKNPEVKMFYADRVLKINNKEISTPEYDWLKLCEKNYIDLGVFVHSRTMYQKYGGFDESLNRLVDWDLLLTYCKNETPLHIEGFVLEYDNTNRADRISKKENMAIACTRIARKHNLKFKKVSALIISYNHSNYIEEAIKSAIHQWGYFIYSIYISDDCSTDDTLEIIKKYEKEYPDIIVNISNKINLGISTNYRKSIELLESDFVAILEGDDYWTDAYKLWDQYSLLLENPKCSMVFSDFIMSGMKKSTSSPVCGKYHKKFLHSRDFVSFDFNPIINFSCVMFRTDKLKKIPDTMYEFRLSEISLGMYFSERGGVGHINKTQSVYRVVETDAGLGSNSLAKQYLAYKLRMTASKNISTFYSKLIKASLLFNYLNNNEFVEYLRKEEQISDYDSYLNSNFGNLKIYYLFYKFLKNK